MGFSPVPGEGGGGGIQLPTLPTPIINGGGSGCDCGCVQSAFNSVVAYVGQVQTWLQAYDQANQTGQQSMLGKIFSQIVAFFQWIAKSWLGQIVKSIWTKLKAIFLAVQKEMAHIVKLFQQYEKLVRYWEQKILGPIINVIQALRKTLVIFRLFHLKFASQLDNYLSGIEGRLTNIFLWYQRELNYVIDALNLIVDPFGLISEGMFITSAVRSIDDLWKGISGYGGIVLGTAQQQSASTPQSFFGSQGMLDYAKSVQGGGTDPTDDAIIAAQRQSFAELGYSS